MAHFKFYCYFFLGLTSSFLLAQGNKLSHALFEACEKGDSKKVLELVNQGADINFKDFNPGQGGERTALTISIQNDSLEVFRVLMRAGANVLYLPKNNSPYNLDPLSFAARHGQLDLVEEILGKGVSIEREGSLFCGTALQQAARSSTVEMIQFLLDKGADLKNRDQNGNTALHYSLENPDKSVLEFLLKLGMRVDEEKKPKDFRAKSESGITPLAYVTVHGQIKNLEVMLKFAKKIKKSVLSHALFCLPADEDLAIEAFRLLEAEGASLKSKNEYDSNILSFYSERGEAPKLLNELILAGVDIDQKDKIGSTPLIYSVACNHPQNVNTLLKNKADVEIKNNFGRSAFHYASGDERSEVLGLLLAHTSSRKRFYKVINERDHEGYTPLHLAAIEGRRAQIQMLIENKASLTKKSRKKENVLHLAKFKFEMLQILTEKKLLEKIINQADCHGNTPLHVACESSTPDLTFIFKLLQEGANNELLNLSLKKPWDLFKKNMTFTEDKDSYEALVAKKLKVKFKKKKEEKTKKLRTTTVGQIDNPTS